MDGSEDDFDGPEGELPVERFVEELERMMIAGHSSLSIRRWAMAGYGVDAGMLERFKDMVNRSWAIESASIAQVKQKKDFLRLKYLEVYEASMVAEKFLPAVKALDSIAKMDGLMDGDVNVTQVNIGGHQGSESTITNGVRDRIQQLAETMRLRAEQRATQNLKIIDVAAAKKSGSGG